MATIYPFPGKPPRAKQPDLSDTCAVDVVQALRYYAAGGHDCGDAARRALRGMACVIDAANDADGSDGARA